MIVKNTLLLPLDSIAYSNCTSKTECEGTVYKNLGSAFLQV
jgi:hypothetical protein